MVNDKIAILDSIETECGKMIGHLTWYDNYYKTILEGKIEGEEEEVDLGAAV